MQKDHIILENYSADELKIQLDDYARDGYEAVNLTTTLDNDGEKFYTVLMVKHGDGRETKDATEQILSYLEDIDYKLNNIDSNTTS